MRVKNLEIVRGDTFGIKVQLTRDGTWTLSGSTIEMSFKFDDDVVHTFEGTIIDLNQKIVSFNPSIEAVATVRSGRYDIQVNDGLHPITHRVGIVEITDDVTP